MLSWFCLQTSTNGLQVKATNGPEALAMADRSGSSEEPHNSSGFPILRFQIALYAEAVRRRGISK
jgi:hypothetical protein